MADLVRVQRWVIAQIEQLDPSPHKPLDGPLIMMGPQVNPVVVIGAGLAGLSARVT